MTVLCYDWYNYQLNVNTKRNGSFKCLYWCKAVIFDWTSVEQFVQSIANKIDIMMSFETCLERVNTCLKLIGLSIDNDDHNKTILQRMRKHWMYCIHAVSFNLSVTCEIMWLIRSLFVGCTLWEITYFLPCITLSLLGDLKVYFFIRHACTAWII